MELNDYQTKALSTVIYNENYKILYPTLGLAGESGEVADKVKKILRDYNGTFNSDQKSEIMKEIGDVLWYVAVLASDLGYSLEEVANYNISKLMSRQNRNVIKGSGDNR